MGWFSAVTSVVGSLFGGGMSASPSGKENNKSFAETVVTGVGGWIDGQDFTEQEKSEANLKLAGAMTDFVTNTLNENSDRSLARRKIAILIIRYEMILLTSGLIAKGFEHPLAETILSIASASGIWGVLTMGVGAFFFGTHLIRSK